MDRREIAVTYAKGWFAPDLVSSFPYELVLFSPDYVGLVKVSCSSICHFGQITEALGKAYMPQPTSSMSSVHLSLALKCGYDRPEVSQM